jgi:chromosome segregation ATPase
LQEQLAQVQQQLTERESALAAAAERVASLERRQQSDAEALREFDDARRQLSQTQEAMRSLHAGQETLHKALEAERARASSTERRMRGLGHQLARTRAWHGRSLGHLRTAMVLDRQPIRVLREELAAAQRRAESLAGQREQHDQQMTALTGERDRLAAVVQQEQQREQQLEAAAVDVHRQLAQMQQQATAADEDRRLALARLEETLQAAQTQTTLFAREKQGSASASEVLQRQVTGATRELEAARRTITDLEAERRLAQERSQEFGLAPQTIEQQREQIAGLTIALEEAEGAVRRIRRPVEKSRLHRQLVFPFPRIQFRRLRIRPARP